MPYRNQVGQDTFKFKAVDEMGRGSTDAVATIEIERGGLRWQYSTNASTGLSADASQPAGPTATGDSTQDYAFRLDWQWRTPRSEARLESTAIRVDPDAGPYLWPRSFHAAFLSGFAQRPLATTIAPADAGRALSASIDRVSYPSSPAAEPAAGAATAGTLSYQRALTVGAEVHLGWVADLDAQGTYAEIGPVAGAYFDAFIGEKSVIKNGVPVKLQPLENVTGHSRFEMGFRLAIKQLESDAPTGALRRSASPDQRSEVFLQPGNPVDLFVLDLLVQRQDALSGLVPHEFGDSRDRWAFRFMSMPPVPAASDVKFLLGIEVNRDLRKRGPRDVRLFYGAALSR